MPKIQNIKENALMLMETTARTPIETALQMDKDGFVSCKNLYDFLGLDKSLSLIHIFPCMANITVMRLNGK